MSEYALDRRSEAKFWVCIGLYIVLGILLASCTHLAPKATDDPLAFLERGEILSEGVCGLKKDGRSEDFNCRVYRSDEEIYLVIYEDGGYTTPVAVFRVNKDESLTLTWRREVRSVRPTNTGKVRSL